MRLHLLHPIHKTFLALVLATLVFFPVWELEAADSTYIRIKGLQKPVIIRMDAWGVAHIEAQTEMDLFFAQGYQAAKDRLFQFEIFRRQATGTVAEILGSRELDRDIGARLFKYRGDMIKELKHYHPRGDLIIRSFVRGINAYIQWALDHQDQLPPEFGILGIVPGFWTPEVVISRHNGLLANVQTELQTARWIAQIGEDRVIDLMNYHPHIPRLKLDSVFTKEGLKEDILKWYNAFRKPLQFQPDTSKTSSFDFPGHKSNPEIHHTNSDALIWNSPEFTEGSNNWVVAGSKTQSGYPFMANDPHRAITIPSLRYLVHLKAPGWNVIGGGEPILPGVSIGHNEYGAWGLTIFQTDMEDLYAYPFDPNKNRYYKQGQWLGFKQIRDTIPLKDLAPFLITFQYTVHGPVVYTDTLRKLVYAVRCAWLEPGCAPYLASLRMNQARTWEEFKQACSYSFVPAENMVWADRKGNIGWQAVGLAPIRPHHSGMVPVMAELKNEWQGYIPVLKRPAAFNPVQGFINTANENLTPENYPEMTSIGFTWADPYRGLRIREVLKESRLFSMSEMKSLQSDYLSLPARQLTPLILDLDFKDEYYTYYQQRLRSWNHELNPSSSQAALYALTERNLKEKLLEQFLPENKDETKDNDISLNTMSIQLLLEMMLSPDGRFGSRPVERRNEILSAAFRWSVDLLVSAMGKDIDHWRYGDEKLKHIKLTHSLSPLLKTVDQNLFNTVILPRGGNSNTVNSTGDVNNQTHGASFRLLVDCADWDLALATNTPGQHGDPNHEYYKDLFPFWAKDQYFPLFYSKKKIEGVTSRVLFLN